MHESRQPIPFTPAHKILVHPEILGGTAKLRQETHQEQHEERRELDSPLHERRCVLVGAPSRVQHEPPHQPEAEEGSEQENDEHGKGKDLHKYLVQGASLSGRSIARCIKGVLASHYPAELFCAI